MKKLPAMLSVSLLAACIQAPDLSTVKTEQAKPIQRYDNFQSVASNGKLLVATASGGAVLSSADAGKTWTRQMLAAPSSVIATAACPDGSFAGLDFYKKVWTVDADVRQWQAHPFEEDINGLAIACDPANRLWVVGSYSTILSSADHGRSWTKQDLGEDSILTTVQFVDAQHGFITGEFGTVLATADGGASWEARPKIPNDFYPYSAVFVDQKQGWVSGLAGAIMHTEDGGETWVAQSNPGAAPMFALVRVGDTLFGLGAGGHLLMRQANEWLPAANVPAVPTTLAAGTALDQNAILVAGSGGSLQVVQLPGAIAAVAATNSGVLSP